MIYFWYIRISKVIDELTSRFLFAFSLASHLIKYLRDFSRLDVSAGSLRLLYLGICGSA